MVYNLCQSLEICTSISILFRYMAILCLQDRIALKAEVHFPNLVFESDELEFGCILNDTESVEHITMTNSSPLEVAYNWSFLKRPPVQRVDPSQHDEGVDMQSECETDSLDEQTDDDDDEPEQIMPSSLTSHNSIEQDGSSSVPPQSVQSTVKDSVQGLLHGVENNSDSHCPRTSETKGDTGSPESNELQPWQLLADPFTPIRIEQVSAYIHNVIRS